MNRNEFFAANETIEFNPVKRLNTRVDQICERILPADLRPDVRAVIEGSRLAALHGRAKEAIETGRFHLIDGMLADFANDLRAALNFELHDGALKVMTPADEVKRISTAGWFEKLAWHKEPWILAQILERGERIEKVDFREITTSKRTITRRDPAFDALRPISMSKEHWFNQICTPPSIVDEAEAAAKREADHAARPFSATSGPNAGEATVMQR